MLKVTLPLQNMRGAAVHMTSVGCSLNAASARIICRSCSSIAFAVIGVRCPGKRFSTGKQWARKQDNICIHDAALGTRQLATARPAPSTQTRQHNSEEGLTLMLLVAPFCSPVIADSHRTGMKFARNGNVFRGQIVGSTPNAEQKLRLFREM